ncbi:uroporphyrinogen-III synthase [Allomesorhizobium camelthorni]|uniref:Uroporphyrinogen-III synthase n=1 Tax=Allomesorhizobium camelthorni TaxID=475069 RepID=A0A6G4W5S0_9HYPH|nr:uroporphyrinogen-III synthase [Mesorhizobium camelthorni]NGO49668.1 uroporphyrinogen-III synthase [Mesorhizobium camelthorni]
MSRRVLVTRPEPGASQTAKRLQAAGFSPLVLPLSQTRALPVDSIPQTFDAVAVTSANAIRHASRALLDRLAGSRCYAVGQKTAAAARQAGLADIVTGPGGAEALADAIVSAEKPGATILYLCGRVRLSAFEERLGTAGIDVRPMEAYDTVGIDHESGFIRRLLHERTVDAVLLYSARAAEAFVSVASRPELASLFKAAGLYCLSPRVASTLAVLQGAQIHVAAEPNEEALLLLLEKTR